MKHRLSVLVVIGLLATACGSGDDEPATATTEAADDSSETAAGSGGDADADEPEATDPPETDPPATDPPETDPPATDPPADAADPDDDDDSGRIVISSFDEIPSECVELMGTFLRDIEPAVSAIDWETATMDDLEAMGTAIDAPSTSFDAEATRIGCDQYEIGVDDDQGLEFAIEVAKREAPGTVGWLEFIATFAGIGGGTSGGDDGDASGPSDCDGALDLLREKAAEYGTISQMPIAEFTELSGVLTSIQSVCTIEQLDEFANDPVIDEFLSG